MVFFGATTFSEWFLHYNTLFTLSVGLCLILMVDLAVKWIVARKKGAKNPPPIALLWSIPLGVVLYLMATDRFLTDYGLSAVFLILLYYLVAGQATVFSSIAAALWAFHKYDFSTLYQVCAVCSTVPILFYNGKQGIRLKWVFYLFYPVHIALFLVIQLFLR